MKKRLKTALLILPLVSLALPFFLSVWHRPFELFPDQSHIQWGVYDDAESGGDSRAQQELSQDGNLLLTYTLGDSLDYPYAGLYMHISQEGEPQNLSKYSHISISIQSEKSQTITMVVTALIQGIKPIYEYELQLDPEKTDYRIPFNELRIPEWWLIEHNMTVHDMDENDFSEVTDIDISNGSVYERNAVVSLMIRNISLVKDYSFLYFPLGMIVLVFYLGYIILHRLKSSDEGLSRAIKQTAIPYDPLMVDSHSSLQSKSIVSFISTNYSDPEMSVLKVSTGSSVPKSKIPQLLKEDFNLSFPQYLNLIRLTEAKRLLRTTDLQITEIALKVGYNNVTHFNRTFKKIENTSPKEFRSQNPKKCN